MAIFPVERDLFFHEYHSSAAYSTATFTLVTTLVEVPFTFVANLVSNGGYFKDVPHTQCQLFGVFMIYLGGLVHSPRIYFQFVASTFAVQNMGEVNLHLYLLVCCLTNFQSIGIIFAAFTPSMGLSVS